MHCMYACTYVCIKKEHILKKIIFEIDYHPELISQWMNYVFKTGCFGKIHFIVTKQGS